MDGCIMFGIATEQNHKDSKKTEKEEGKDTDKV
jgi:hypothetical protein